MTSFAARLRAGDPAQTFRRGLRLTFLSPFGLELAATGGGAAVACSASRLTPPAAAGSRRAP